MIPFKYPPLTHFFIIFLILFFLQSSIQDFPKVNLSRIKITWRCCFVLRLLTIAVKHDILNVLRFFIRKLILVKIAPVVFCRIVTVIIELRTSNSEHLHWLWGRNVSPLPLHNIIYEPTILFIWIWGRYFKNISLQTNVIDNKITFNKNITCHIYPLDLSFICLWFLFNICIGTN